MRAQSFSMNEKQDPVHSGFHNLRGIEDLDCLMAVHREGSFLAAAGVLGVATSTVGRRVAALEQRLGLQLVERRTDGACLTSEGRAAVELGGRLGAQLQAGLRDLRHQAEHWSGVVRLTAGEGFADPVAAAVQRFRRQHPRVTFELALDARVLNLGDREADLALRTVDRREPTLIYRPLGALRYGLWASTRYVRRAGMPLDADTLQGHDVVRYQAPLHGHPAERWLAGLGGTPSVTCNTHAAVVAAARAGAGVAALPDVSATGLVRVWPTVAGPRLPVYLVSDREAVRRPHVAAFALVLAEHVRGQLGAS